jgi:hypothetical protein
MASIFMFAFVDLSVWGSVFETSGEAVGVRGQTLGDCAREMKSASIHLCLVDPDLAKLA